MTAVMTPLTAGTTVTTGTGAFVISASAVPVGSGFYRTWSQVPNGTVTVCSRWDSAGNFEHGLVTVSIAAGVATLTWSPRKLTSVTGNAAVSWSGGSQNVFSTSPAWGNIPDNGFSEMAAFQAAARTSLGLDTAAVHPAYRLGFVPLGPDGTVDGLWVGGTTGHVVRNSGSANTMTDAGNTDTAAQLLTVAFKTSLGYLASPGLITGLSALTIGATYYLGASGAMITPGPAVTAGGSIKLVILGWAPSATSFLWQPRIAGKG